MLRKATQIIYIILYIRISSKVTVYIGTIFLYSGVLCLWDHIPSRNYFGKYTFILNGSAEIKQKNLKILREDSSHFTTPPK